MELLTWRKVLLLPLPERLPSVVKRRNKFLLTLCIFMISILVLIFLWIIPAQSKHTRSIGRAERMLTYLYDPMRGGVVEIMIRRGGTSGIEYSEFAVGVSPCTRTLAIRSRCPFSISRKEGPMLTRWSGSTVLISEPNQSYLVDQVATIDHNVLYLMWPGTETTSTPPLVNVFHLASPGQVRAARLSFVKRVRKADANYYREHW